MQIKTRTNQSVDSDSIFDGHRVRGVTVLDVLIAMAVVLILVALLLPARRGSNETSRRYQCGNNFKQIGLALITYCETYGAFPPAYTVDEVGKPLHSWRTLLLPFVDQETLYNKLDLTKPWDDPVNAAVFRSAHPAIFRCPSAHLAEQHTTYVVAMSPSSCLRRGESSGVSDIIDGPANTLMVIEVDTEHSVPWMAPSDVEASVFLSIGPNSTLAHPGALHGCFADGSVRLLPIELSPEHRRALISINGQDTVPEF